jgi:hypothetical protein
MTWDEPSPTITTLAYNFGAGRFGHPEQDRPITLREAAVLQSFPKDYEFVAPGEPVEFASLGRLIGNAVPPRLAKAVGEEIVRHVAAFKCPVRTVERGAGVPEPCWLVGDEGSPKMELVGTPIRNGDVVVGGHRGEQRVEVPAMVGPLPAPW